MSHPTDIDRRHLARAIELAEGGRGKVSPNPLVGAVIGRHDEVLGEGFHQALGQPHAEIEALRAAEGHDLGNATLYVSLEPCCHHGRTPPCTDAIREAGIGRLVVASDDPSEHASGRGLGILRDEGIEVVVADGELAVRARLLNQSFRKHARTGRPWVLFKSAMTLDGIGTALADDPQLTARISDPAYAVLRQPRRVVFDSLARLPLDSQLVHGAREVPLTVVVSRAAPRTATDALATHGAEVIVATGQNEPARVRSALDQLGADGVGSILLEGGPHLAGAFMDAGEVDEMRLFLAPMVLGGRTARDPLEGEGVDAIADAARALTLECERVGEDLLVSARIKEW
jgi:diaminohydroxyphosphoribosylaminopyrimidine deaminase/5-amino-6-(5-phosphoribosylamino)uracil reductase